ncbi:MAG: complex I NDUFA9 subunit family protein, partial [Propionivibrio sp.]
VANAFVDSLRRSATHGQTYELCGPTQYSLRELVEYTGEQTGHRRPVIGLPAGLAELQAKLLSLLPNPPMSPDNLRSMQVPNVCDGTHGYPGWQPQPLEAIAPAYLSPLRPRRRLAAYRRQAGR